MIKRMEDEARKTKEEAEKMKELERAEHAKIIAKMKADEQLEREKLMAQLKEEMNKKNLGGISEHEVDKSTQKLGLAVNALKDKPDDTKLESNTLEAIEEVKAMRRLYNIEQNRVLKLNQEREEKEKLLREQEAMMQKEREINEDLLRQQEAAAQKKRKDEEEQLRHQELALQKEMELLEKQKLENMKMHSKLKEDLEQKIAEEKKELLRAQNEMQTQRVKEEEKRIEKANKKALKMEEAMATLKYEMEQKLMESQKALEKEMKDKIAAKTEAASQSKLHYSSVAGSESENIEHDKASDEKFPTPRRAKYNTQGMLTKSKLNLNRRKWTTSAK